MNRVMGRFRILESLRRRQTPGGGGPSLLPRRPAPSAGAWGPGGSPTPQAGASRRGGPSSEGGAWLASAARPLAWSQEPASGWGLGAGGFKASPPLFFLTCRGGATPSSGAMAARRGRSRRPGAPRLGARGRGGGGRGKPWEGRRRRDDVPCLRPRRIPEKCEKVPGGLGSRGGRTGGPRTGGPRRRRRAGRRGGGPRGY